MKIAIVLPGGVDRTGEYRVIPAFLSLIARLSQVHEVHVFALRQEAKADCWQLVGATIHNIGDGRTRWRAIEAICAEHARDPFDLIHAIFSGSCSFVAIVAATLLRLPSMVHIAGGELVALHQIGYGGRRTWRGRLREALVLRKASIVTAASAPIVDSLRTLGIQGLRVPLGVDLRAWAPMAPRVRQDKQARLIHVGSLNYVKDQTTLLHALGQLREVGLDFHMDVVGVDTLDGEMQALATQRGLDQCVRFLGFKTQSELRRIMHAADLLVMSSLHEAGPLVLLEAAVMGVPTVGTNVGHIAEWAPAAALAVPVGDAKGLAQAIHMVMTDESLRLRLAGEAQRRAITEDADYTAQTFDALYQQLLVSYHAERLRSALSR